ncbi:hypothetical protein RI054_33g128590 [Pseudoscourfieldia marina]
MGRAEADAKAALRERFQDDDTRCNQAVAIYEAQDRARDCSRAAGEVAKAGASEADAMAALRERFKDTRRGTTKTPTPSCTRGLATRQLSGHTSDRTMPP